MNRGARRSRSRAARTMALRRFVVRGDHRGSCHTFARNYATRNLTPPHDASLYGASHLGGCVVTGGLAGWREPPAHRWQGWQGWGRRFVPAGGSTQKPQARPGPTPGLFHVQGWAGGPACHLRAIATLMRPRSAGSAPAPPTNPAPEPTQGRRLIQSGRPRWLHRLPLVLSRHATAPTVPRFQGHGRPPGQAFRRDAP